MIFDIKVNQKSMLVLFSMLYLQKYFVLKLAWFLKTKENVITYMTDSVD